MMIPSFIPENATAFYEATGTHSFLKTCNVWTGNVRNNVGIKISYRTPFDACVFYHLKE